MTRVFSVAPPGPRDITRRTIASEPSHQAHGSPAASFSLVIEWPRASITPARHRHSSGPSRSPPSREFLILEGAAALPGRWGELRARFFHENIAGLRHPSASRSPRLRRLLQPLLLRRRPAVHPFSNLFATMQRLRNSIRN